MKMTCRRFVFIKFRESELNNFLCASVLTGVASIELTDRTDTSLSIAWAEPQNTDFARYYVSISSTDGGEDKSVTVNR